MTGHTAKYPAYTKGDLEGFIKNGHDLTGAMAAEVARRTRRDTGDVSVMTDGERLRLVNRPTRSDDNAAYRRDMIDAGRGHLLR